MNTFKFRQNLVLLSFGCWIENLKFGLQEKNIEFFKEIEKTILSGLKIKLNHVKKAPIANYTTHFSHQNEMSNKEIHQEVFEELRCKCGATWKYEEFINAPGSFRVWAVGERWGREKGVNRDLKDADTYKSVTSVIVEALWKIFVHFFLILTQFQRHLPLT